MFKVMPIPGSSSEKTEDDHERQPLSFSDIAGEVSSALIIDGSLVETMWPHGELGQSWGSDTERKIIRSYHSETNYNAEHFMRSPTLRFS